MAEISLPWSGITIGDATNAPYSDSDWWSKAQYEAQNLRANAGILRNSGTAPYDALFVTANTVPNTQCIVRAGAANVNGTLYYNDSDLLLSFAPNASGNPRIDTVVLRKQFSISGTNPQTVRAAILQGTPAASPVATALTQNATTWEIPLAFTTLQSGFTAVSTFVQTGNYTDRRDCVYIHNVLNNSGATLEYGTVVQYSTVGVGSVITATIANANLGTNIFNHQLLGVWQASTPNGGYGSIVIRGLTGILARGDVGADQAISAGDRLKISQQGAADNGTVRRASTAYGWQGFVGWALGGLNTSNITTLIPAYVDMTFRQQQTVESPAATSAQTRNNAAFADVTPSGLSSTIIFQGRPIRIQLVGVVFAQALPRFRIQLNGATTVVTFNAFGITGANTILLPIYFEFIDTNPSILAHGSTLTYTVQWANEGLGTSSNINALKMILTEVENYKLQP